MPINPIIEVSSLTKIFSGNKAVDNISFEVYQGEILGLLGPNGAGKTTTIRMLTTMLKPNSGKILVNNFNTLNKQQEVRSSFGIVFQDFSLDNELTALENLNFHAALYSVPKKLAQERTILANERNTLAYIRTGFASFTVGIALIKLFEEHIKYVYAGYSAVFLGIVLILLGIVYYPLRKKKILSY